MPDPILATDPLETRRRRARFRAWHRGMKEADLVIGGFADRRMAAFTEAQLVQFEALLVEADTDIMKWITGEVPLPAHQDNDIVRGMIAEARNFTT